MTIRVALHHETSYRYPRPIMLGPQLVRLRPAYHGRTPIGAYSLKVEPADHFLNWQQDPFANPVARLVFPKPASEFRVTVDLVAEMAVINPFDFFIEESAQSWPFGYDESTRHQLAPYLVRGPLTDKLLAWVDSLPHSAERTIDFLVEVNRRTQAKIAYLVRLEPGVQSPEETLAIGSGSCRDSAWLLVETFRQLGMAARFVSGYLIQLTPDQKPIDGPVGPDADFCDLHAWTEVYLPGAGWIGLDPTSGLFAGEGHIPLACTPSYSGAAPISGGHEPCDVEFSHAMSVARVHEDPRVTLPYSPAVWEEIRRVGREVDDDLKRHDVRLTIGGEPTFVSVDNMDDPQWNTEAVGEEKRVLSNLLLLRLRDRFAPGGLLHYGQGKWYPGESLPRWALTCLWRQDGQPLWHRPEYIADEGTDYGHTAEDAARFIRHLADELDVSARLSFPVYEDVFHYLWRENRLPVDVDPTDPKLEDPNERAMMIRTFRAGLTEAAGYVLPLRRAWWQARPGWISGRWPVRSDRVYLIPGDSPIGLRLPQDSLPLAGRDTGAVYTAPLDPLAPRPPLSPLPKGNERLARRNEPPSEPPVGPVWPIHEQQLDEDDSVEAVSEADVVNTALCVEARHGRLSVFMPPTQRLEDYLDLVEAIEETCAALDIPVLLEGYLPPPDDRIRFFKVTPDPGVIEVNTQPSESWEQLETLTETLYGVARECRLGTEKFDLDGRHTGTGGGNHVVLGGPTPADSPFLRRPDLLASMIRFWHNHPALSYLFSSRFIGPTSQAPRMDESRRDAVYETEIALAQLPPAGAAAPPWLVDRLFRDLLVDLTGNTHRAELCIDKLYSPEGVTGRLGLVELRGFEMPPHWQMSLAQQLLVRAAIAAFWERPYREPLADWGTALYDRFMLPHFVWRDLCDLLGELSRNGGVDLKAEWFIPHHEFRFPKIGDVAYDGVELEFRSAIEPWYVLGEEPGTGGTARYVDSSVERMQVSASGFDPSRHAVLCGGVRVPMHRTGRPFHFVAGIRYRAWQPPRCLHPTIPVQTPLRFDLVDVKAARSIGGCTYHAYHPAGINYEVFPVNANEAEARRSARFEKRGLRGGRVELPDLPPHPGVDPYPLTLDLRRFPVGA